MPSSQTRCQTALQDEKKQIFAVAVVVAVVFDLAVPLGMLPFVQGRKWMTNETCLSEASLFHFPFFALHKQEAAGQHFAVAFLLLTFLWRDKKK